MLCTVLGYAVGMAAELFEKVICGVLSVKELPDENASGVQAKTTQTKGRIGIEENCPVVKLLPEDYISIPYRSFIIVHGSASRFPTAIAQTVAHLSGDVERFLQFRCQRTAIVMKDGSTRIYSEIADYS
jgi:hypothetical protein